MGTCNTCKANKVCDHNQFGFENCGNYIPADALEVVMCKDCTSWRRNIGFVDSPNGHCFYTGLDTNQFDYCSYGERREK